MKVQREDWLDIDYTVIARMEYDDDVFVNFELYAISSHGYSEYKDGKSTHYNVLQYPRKGTLDGLDLVDDPELSDVEAAGTVKWDGCSNIHFPASEECMMHNCTREQLRNFGTALVRVHELAEKMIGEKWNP